MKKTTFAIATLSLWLTCSTAGLGQSNAKARVKPPVGGGGGGQICTGCCDPCYSDDWWKVRQPGARKAKPAKPAKGKR